MIYPILSFLLLGVAAAQLMFGQSYTLHQHLPYDHIAGVSPNLLSLDVYEPLGAQGLRPVVIYVHGGSWKGGTKSNVGSKAELFTSHNYVFVSINYRLSPDPPDTAAADAVRFPIHPRDVAKAISEVHGFISQFHGDPQNLHLLGHSAGAHLVNLVATNQDFLARFGLSPANIGCVCSLDAGVYEVRYEIAIADASRRLMLLSAFGTDSSLYSQASPLLNIEAAESLPDFLLVHQNTPHRIQISEEFRDSLIASGHEATSFNAHPYGHGPINTLLGHPADSIGLTDTVIHFFQVCSQGVTALPAPQAPTLLQAYPNPTRQLVHWQAMKADEVHLLNSWGQLVSRKALTSPQLDLTSRPAGWYWIRLLYRGAPVGIIKVEKQE